jgi:6-phosphogluconolactonase
MSTHRQPTIKVVDDPDALADLAADMIARTLTERMSEKDGPVTVFLSGGSTPRVTYTRLRDADVDWSRVHFFLGDERWVAHDHAESNARMARESFIEDIEATFHVLPTHLESPAEAARYYEEVLAEVFGRDEVKADLVILGLGPDGHTASLFPGTEALDEYERLYVANWVPEKETWRLTATYRLLHEAHKVIFLATGKGKAQVVAEILNEGVQHPAHKVMQGMADVTWFLDDAAASQLELD